MGDITNTMGKREPHVHFLKRRAEIRKIIINAGLWNVDRKDLAKRYNISERQVYYDINAVIKSSLSKKDMQEICGVFVLGGRQAYKEAQKILRSEGNPNIKLKAAKTVMDIAEQYTKILEKYGLKEQIVTKIELTGAEKPLTYKDFKDIYDEVHPEDDGKRSKDGANE